MSDIQRDERSEIDLYVDGLLEDSARQEFENRMEQDGELRQTIEQQRDIDNALRRVCAVPSPQAILSHLPVDEPFARHPSFQRQTAPRVVPLWRRMGSIAAILSTFGVGLWLIWDGVYPNRHITAGVRMPTLDQVYNAQVASGFTPYWTCDNDTQFADTFKTRLGQSLLIHAPADTKTWGLAYASSITPKTVLLLAEVNKNKVIVFIDRLDVDPGQNLSPQSGLNVFVRVVGHLVLYEVSPMKQAILLDRFVNPDAPPAPPSSDPCQRPASTRKA